MNDNRLTGLWEICAAVLCSCIIRSIISESVCDLWNLCAHKRGQRRVWRMSCLLHILTGAGNVGRTHTVNVLVEKQIADPSEHLYAYSKCLSLKCYILLRETPLWFLSRWAQCKNKKKCDKRLFCCWQLTDGIVKWDKGGRWGSRKLETCHYL